MNKQSIALRYSGRLSLFDSTAKLFQEAKFFVIVSLRKVMIQVQTDMDYSAG